MLILHTVYCPHAKSWADKAHTTNSAHDLTECANVGRCDRTVVSHHSPPSSLSTTSVLPATGGPFSCVHVCMWVFHHDRENVCVQILSLVMHVKEVST